jgi:hypothetical protein
VEKIKDKCENCSSSMWDLKTYKNTFSNIFRIPKEKKDIKLCINCFNALKETNKKEKVSVKN